MENLNDIEKVFTSIGIAIRDTSSEMRDGDDVLDELASKWKTLNDVEKNAVATAAAGTRQRENFLVLMNNYNNALALEADSLNSAGTAAEKYEAYNDSLEASLNRVTTEFEELVLQMQESNGIKILAEASANILDFIGNAHILEGALTALLLIFGKFVITNLINSYKSASSQITAYGTALNYAANNTEVANARFLMFDSTIKKLNQTYLQKLLLENKSISSIIEYASTTGKSTDEIIEAILQNTILEEAERKELKTKLQSAIATKTGTVAVDSYGNALVGASVKVKGFTASLKAMGKALIADPITATITAISALVSLFNVVVDSIETSTDKFILSATLSIVKELFSSRVTLSLLTTMLFI